MGGESVGPVKVLVDDTSHAILAVVAGGLGTVVPDGSLVLDDDLEDVGGLGTLGGLEAAEEGLGEGGIRDAGLAEGRLGDRVVLGEEVPLDNVPNLRDEVFGIEEEGASATGDDGVGDTSESGCLVRARGCSRGWQRGDGSRRGKDGDQVLGEHFDRVKYGAGEGLESVTSNYNQVIRDFFEL